MTGLKSSNIEAFGWILSSKLSFKRCDATGFSWFGGWMRYKFLKVLSDVFVSFGVHDFVDKKLIGDFILVLFGNMW